MFNNKKALFFFLWLQVIVLREVVMWTLSSPETRQVTDFQGVQRVSW
jgi:hypothetical protein